MVCTGNEFSFVKKFSSEHMVSIKFRPDCWALQTF